MHGSLYFPYLHHEDYSVEGDHGQHAVLEGGRDHEVPHAVLKGVSVLRHVAGEGLGADGKIYACSLTMKSTRKERLASALQ